MNVISVLVPLKVFPHFTFLGTLPVTLSWLLKCFSTPYPYQALDIELSMQKVYSLGLSEPLTQRQEIH